MLSSSASTGRDGSDAKRRGRHSLVTAKWGGHGHGQGRDGCSHPSALASTEVEP